MAKLSANGHVLARLTRFFRRDADEPMTEETLAFMSNGHLLKSSRFHSEYSRPGTWKRGAKYAEEWREQVLRMARSGKWILTEGSFPELGLQTLDASHLHDMLARIQPDESSANDGRGFSRQTRREGFRLLKTDADEWTVDDARRAQKIVLTHRAQLAGFAESLMRVLAGYNPTPERDMANAAADPEFIAAMRRRRRIAAVAAEICDRGTPTDEQEIAYLFRTCLYDGADAIGERAADPRTHVAMAEDLPEALLVREPELPVFQGEEAEDALRRFRKKFERALKDEGKYLDASARNVENVRRCAELVAVLLPDHPRVRACREITGDAERRIQEYRARLPRDLSEIDRRLERFARERVVALQSMKALKLRKVMEENLAPTQSLYVCDRAMMMLRSAVPAKRVGKIPAAAVQAGAQDVVDGWKRYTSREDKSEAHLAGWMESGWTKGPKRLAVAVDAAGYVFLDADRVRFISSMTKFDGLRLVREKGRGVCTVFMKNGEDVAVLMNVRSDLALDHDALLVKVVQESSAPPPAQETTAAEDEIVSVRRLETPEEHVSPTQSAEALAPAAHQTTHPANDHGLRLVETPAPTLHERIDAALKDAATAGDLPEMRYEIETHGGDVAHVSVAEVRGTLLVTPESARAGTRDYTPAASEIVEKIDQIFVDVGADSDDSDCGFQAALIERHVALVRRFPEDCGLIPRTWRMKRKSSPAPGPPTPPEPPTSRRRSLSPKEAAKEIRTRLKSEHGWSSRRVSVTSDAHSISARIKDRAVDAAAVRSIVNEYESIRRCELTHDILSGGTFVDVDWSWRMSKDIEKDLRSKLDEKLDVQRIGPLQFVRNEYRQDYFRLHVDGVDVRDLRDYLRDVRDLILGEDRRGVAGIAAQATCLMLETGLDLEEPPYDDDAPADGVLEAEYRVLGARLQRIRAGEDLPLGNLRRVVLPVLRYRLAEDEESACAVSSDEQDEYLIALRDLVALAESVLSGEGPDDDPPGTEEDAPVEEAVLGEPALIAEEPATVTEEPAMVVEESVPDAESSKPKWKNKPKRKCDAEKRADAALEALQLPQGVELRMPADHLFRDHARGTSWTPEVRAHQYRADYLIGLRYLVEEGGEHLTQRDVEAYCNAYAKDLAARGRCLSTMITGRSNFPVRKAEKANAAADKASEALRTTKKRILKRLKRRQQEAETAAAGGVVEQQRAKLENLRQSQEAMKAANKIVHSKPKNQLTEAKVEKLVALGIKEDNARELFKPDFGTRVGFPRYALQNNLANIKSAEKRLAELEQREAAAGLEDREWEFDGFKVVAAFGDDRLRIFHDEIPSKETRQVLKRSGWKFSRFNACWQRQLTQNAVSSICYDFGIELPRLEEMRKPAASVDDDAAPVDESSEASADVPDAPPEPPAPPTASGSDDPPAPPPKGPLKVSSRRNQYEMNYERLEKILGRPLDQIEPGFYMKLKSPGEAVMDLSVEAIGECCFPGGGVMISLCHYFIQNGDLCQDPEVVVRVLPPGTGEKAHYVKPSAYDENYKPFYGRVEALSFQQALPPIYHETYADPEGKTIYLMRHTSVNSFLSDWLKNLKTQGHQVVEIRNE